MPPGRLVYTPGDPNPRCSDCNFDSFAEDRSEGCVCCKRCGLVVEEQIFVDDGFHYKTDEHGFVINQHHGAPINPFLMSSSMSTMIGHGNNCSRLMRNLHQQLSMPSRERSLYHKFKEIKDALETRLNISSDMVSTWAQEIWKDLKDKRVITKGDKNTAMLACCIYYACKLSNYKLTRKDVLQAFQLGQNGSKKFKQASTLLLTNLQDRSYYSTMLKDQINPDDYVVRMLSHLKHIKGQLFWELVKEVRRLNSIVEESEKMANLQTNTVLATILFVAAHVKCSAEYGVNLEMISATYNINIQTLKNKLKVLLTIPEIQDITQSAVDSFSKRVNKTGTKAKSVETTTQDQKRQKAGI